MTTVNLSDPAVLAFDILRAVFPVAAVKQDEPGQLATPKFFGTAFAISPGVFLTAAHVARNARAAGTPVLCGPRDQEEAPLGAAQIEEIELFDSVDVAVVHCGLRDNIALFDFWRATPMQSLDDVSMFGYPHALTREEGRDRLDVVFRSYKGYVIATRGFERLPSRPGVYEVSTPFPEGSSGAPLLWSKDGRMFLVGMVLGEDVVSYGGVENRVGIAISTLQLAICKSERLGKRLGELIQAVTVSPVSPSLPSSVP